MAVADSDWPLADWPLADWAVADWAAADWLRVPLGLPGVATGEPVAVAAVAPLRVPAVEDPVSDWPVAGSTGTVLESVGDGLAELQVGLAEAVGLVEPLADPLADPLAEELSLAVGDAPGCGAELCDADEPGAELLGLVVGAGGRLDLGGRTLVTSLTTGSGLSGTVETPSR